MSSQCGVGFQLRSDAPSAVGVLFLVFAPAMVELLLVLFCVTLVFSRGGRHVFVTSSALLFLSPALAVTLSPVVSGCFF